jgi:hypothetical protein
MRVILLFFFSVNLSFNLKAQTLSIGSKDTLANKNNFYSNQYMSPLYAKNTNFYYGDLIKKKNEYAAVHTYWRKRSLPSLKKQQLRVVSLQRYRGVNMCVFSR